MIRSTKTYEESSVFKSTIFECQECKSLLFSKISGVVAYCKCGKSWVVQTGDSVKASSAARNTKGTTYI